MMTQLMGLSSPIVNISFCFFRLILVILIKGEDMDFERITVDRDNRGFQTVFKLFHSTISESKASILMVSRIKNDFLLDR